MEMRTHLLDTEQKLKTSTLAALIFIPMGTKSGQTARKEKQT